MCLVHNLELDGPRISAGSRDGNISAAGIVRVALKAFVEGIRLSVLTKEALQQLQHEVFSLRQALPWCVAALSGSSML